MRVLRVRGGKDTEKTRKKEKEKERKLHLGCTDIVVFAYIRFYHDEKRILTRKKKKNSEVNHGE